MGVIGMNVLDAFYNSIKNNKDVKNLLFYKTIDRSSLSISMSIAAYVLIDKKIKNNSIEDYTHKMNEFLNSFELVIGEKEKLAIEEKEILPKTYIRKFTQYDEKQILLGEIGYDGVYGYVQEKFIDTHKEPKEPEMIQLIESPKLLAYLSLKLRPFRSRGMFEKYAGKNYSPFLDKALLL
jgi:hypothetical protein